jgi:hypothetical protein
MPAEDVVLIPTITLRALLDGLDLDRYPKLVNSIPCCSNYLVTIRTGFWGDRTYSLNHVRRHYYYSHLTLREHFLIKSLTSRCKIGLTKTQDRLITSILNRL